MIIIVELVFIIIIVIIIIIIISLYDRILYSYIRISTINTHIGVYSYIRILDYSIFVY